MTDIVSIGPQNRQYYETFLPISVREAYLDDKRIALFGIDEDDTACGAMAVRFLRPEAELVWIFLAEDYRGRGIATMVMIDLMMRLRDEGYARLAVRIPPASAETTRMTKLLAAFSHSLEETETATAFSTPEELRAAKELAAASAASVPLSQVSARTLGVLEQAAEESGDDFVPMPIRRDAYMEELSAVYLEDGEPKGVLLAQRTAPQLITISYIYTISPNPAVVLDMMRFFLEGAAKLPGRVFLRMNLVNPDLLAFLTKRAHVETQRERIARIDLSWVDRVRSRAQLELSA